MIKVLKFYADWCGPCKILKPRIEALKIKYPKIEFVDINIEEQRDLVELYSIMSVPTIVILDGGGEVDRMSGVASDDRITRHFS